MIGRPAGDPTLRRPRPLRPGDQVAVVSPSSPVLDAERLAAGIAVLRSWDLEVRVAPHVHASVGHLAGDDLVRADDLNAAVRDPAVRAVFASRGGYGAARVADLTDWEALRNDPTWLVGFSDVTALHAAAWERARLVTVHGQFAGRLSLQPAPRLAQLHGLLTGAIGEGAELDLGGTALVGGTCSGRLLGGNLALLGAGMGTVDQLDLRGTVLLLEDVGEAPYRIDRTLMQLLRSGALDEVEGVVVGTFVDCDPPAQRPSATVDEVVDEIVGSLGVPVVVGAPVGHTDGQLPLPLGVRVRLDADASRLTLLEDVAASGG